MSDNAVGLPRYLERTFNRRKAIDEGRVAEMRDEMEAWANPLYDEGYTEIYWWMNPMDFYDTVTLRVQRPR